MVAFQAGDRARIHQSNRSARLSEYFRDFHIFFVKVCVPLVLEFLLVHDYGDRVKASVGNH